VAGAAAVTATVARASSAQQATVAPETSPVFPAQHSWDFPFSEETGDAGHGQTAIRAITTVIRMVMVPNRLPCIARRPMSAISRCSPRAGPERPKPGFRGPAPAGGGKGCA